MRTAESVMLTCWPPAPEERKVSMRTSSRSISILISSSTCGKTNTEAKEVCRRAAESNGEMRTRENGSDRLTHFAQNEPMVSRPRLAANTWIVAPAIAASYTDRKSVQDG